MNNTALNYHLMHPGGDSGPGDPNAAFYLDGTYHLHYILAASVEGQAVLLVRARHQYRHAALDMADHQTAARLHRSRHVQRHRLYHQGGKTGGHLPRRGLGPQPDRHRQGPPSCPAGRSHIPLRCGTPTVLREEMRHWDPDCFLIGDTYYAISGGENPPLLKSRDLRTWTNVGPFLQHDMPDVATGEDVSCPNFFPIGGKWMLLCISPPSGLPLLHRRLGCESRAVCAGAARAHELASRESEPVRHGLVARGLLRSRKRPDP